MTLLTVSTSIQEFVDALADLDIRFAFTCEDRSGGRESGYCLHPNFSTAIVLLMQRVDAKSRRLLLGEPRRVSDVPDAEHLSWAKSDIRDLQNQDRFTFALVWMMPDDAKRRLSHSHDLTPDEAMKRLVDMACNHLAAECGV